MILIVKNISIEGPGTLGEYFVKKGYEIKTVDLEKKDKLPSDLEDIKAVVVLGGPMNVYEEDKYPYLKEEGLFINKVLSLEIPFLGICLGAQLLAKAIGGRVIRAAKEEIGFYKVRLTSDGIKDRLFRGLSEEFDVFQWHGDTFELPMNARVLVSSEICRNQGFIVGKNAYGLQFHVEVDQKSIGDWAREYTDVKDKSLYNERLGMADVSRAIHRQFKNNAGTIYANFESVIGKN